MTETAKRLAKDVYTTSVHGMTGRHYEEGTLEAGALIKDPRFYGLFVRFEASTDNGKTWYTQEALHMPVTAPR